MIPVHFVDMNVNRIQSLKTFNLTSCGESLFTGFFFGSVGSTINTEFTHFECTGVLKVSKDLTGVPNLSKQSLDNILECLYDSPTPLRLTLGQNNMSKITAEQIKIAQTKNWTLA